MLNLDVNLFSENKFSSIGPIYYEYGSMVITYEDSNKAVRALYCLRESHYEDKHLLGKYKFVVYWFEKKTYKKRIYGNLYSETHLRCSHF
jgi:hypothetical protein